MCFTGNTIFDMLGLRHKGKTERLNLNFGFALMTLFDTQLDQSYFGGVAWLWEVQARTTIPWGERAKPN